MNSFVFRAGGNHGPDNEKGKYPYLINFTRIYTDFLLNKALDPKKAFEWLTLNICDVISNTQMTRHGEDYLKSMTYTLEETNRATTSET